jgi:hypothetical protein
MSTAHSQFATALVDYLVSTNRHLRPHPHVPSKILVDSRDGEVSLDLTPFEARPQPARAAFYFEGVRTIDELLEAYRAARASESFESDHLQLNTKLHPYAREFLEALLNRARETMDDEDVRRIAGWVSNLDVYTAVKTVESLLNSKADIALLEIAENKGWDAHFDHLAIRCGCALNGDGQRVAAMLCNNYGYTPSQLEEERTYRFADGWNAYPLYKILENGQVLRLFLDESDGSNPVQIIQHWHRVYGYTAHHLAIRISRREGEGRMAVPLPEVASVLADKGIALMIPTGEYTHGLLVQVFTKPAWNPQVPSEIKQELRAYGSDLESAIENAKLIELLSRREVAPEFAYDFYKLYGLAYEKDNPLHSVPLYQYFLPAQAAHVIRTSVDARKVRA